MEPPPVIEIPPAIIDPPVIEPPLPAPPVVEPPAPPAIIEPPAPVAVDPPVIEPPLPAPMAEISLAVFNFDRSRPLESGAAIRIVANGENYYLSCNNTCSMDFPPGTSLTISGEWFGIPVALNTGPNYLTTLTEDLSLDLNFAVYDDPNHRGRIAFENIRLDVSPFYSDGRYQLQVTGEGTVPMRFQILDSSLEPRTIELNGIPYQATSTSVLTGWDFNIFTRVLSANIEFQSTLTFGIGWSVTVDGINRPNGHNNNNVIPNGNNNNNNNNNDVIPNGNDNNNNNNDNNNFIPCNNECIENLVVDATVPEFGGAIGLLASAVFSIFLILQFRRSKAFRANLPTSA